MDVEEFLEKLDGLEYDEVRHKVDFGFYANRKAEVAKIWLERNAPVLPEPATQPNIVIVVAPKSKILKWVFSKLGIGVDKTNLIEHD